MGVGVAIKLATGSDFWRGIAQSYKRNGPPFRPSPEDTSFVEVSARSLAKNLGRPLSSLILGVTPSLVTMNWPPNSSVLAVDRTPGMITHLWNGSSRPDNAEGVSRSAACSDWSMLPLPEGSVDLVAGDGSLNCVDYASVQALAASVRRVLRPQGIVLVRVYLQPDNKESADEVVESLDSGIRETFHEFRFRLLMAHQTSVSKGLSGDAIRERWSVHRSRILSTPAATRWNADEVEIMDNYQGKQTIMHFPNMAELKEVLSEHFSIQSIAWPTYCLGDRCPTLALSPRTQPGE